LRPSEESRDHTKLFVIEDSMNTIWEMTLNPCNTPVSAIPKRQVSSRRKVQI
jgi:hypothetical protein